MEEDRRMKRKLISLSLIVIVLAATVILFPTATQACKCVEPPSVEKEFERSKAVFSGKVIDIRNDKNNRNILFEINETWKGISQTQIILRDELSSCSLNFFEGESYLVYAYDFKDELTTNICDRTKELSSADEDLATLGKGSTPTKEVDLKNKLRSPVVNYIYIWLPLVGIFIVLLIVIRRRSRS
jgi:hypothetical protein